MLPTALGRTNRGLNCVSLAERMLTRLDVERNTELGVDSVRLLGGPVTAKLLGGSGTCTPVLSLRNATCRREWL